MLQRSGLVQRIGESHFYSSVNEAVTGLTAGPALAFLSRSGELVDAPSRRDVSPRRALADRQLGPYRPVVGTGVGEDDAGEGSHGAAHEDVVDLAVGTPGGPAAADHGAPPAAHEQPDRRPPRVHVPGQHGVGPGLGAQAAGGARRNGAASRRAGATCGCPRRRWAGRRPSRRPQWRPVAYGRPSGGATPESDWPQSGARVAPGRRSPCCRSRPPASACRDWTPWFTGRTPSM